MRSFILRTALSQFKLSDRPRCSMADNIRGFDRMMYGTNHRNIEASRTERSRMNARPAGLMLGLDASPLMRAFGFEPEVCGQQDPAQKRCGISLSAVSGLLNLCPEEDPAQERCGISLSAFGGSLNSTVASCRVSSIYMVSSGFSPDAPHLIVRRRVFIPTCCTVV